MWTNSRVDSQIDKSGLVMWGSSKKPPCRTDERKDEISMKVFLLILKSIPTFTHLFMRLLTYILISLIILRQVWSLTLRSSWSSQQAPLQVRTYKRTYMFDCVCITSILSYPVNDCKNDDTHTNTSCCTVTFMILRRSRVSGGQPLRCPQN